VLSKTASEETLKLEVAQEHDRRMKELEADGVKLWVEMAEIAIIVRDNNEAPLLGYESWTDWLEFAAPQSAGNVHQSIRILEQLADDIPRETVRQIPKGNAKVLVHMSKADRRDSAWTDKAKEMKPKTFVKEVQEKRPGLHIEKLVAKRFGFSLSQSEIIEGLVEMYRIIEQKPEASYEEALEGAASEYVLEHLKEYERVSGKKFPVSV
jgi:hypothetical protein